MGYIWMVQVQRKVDAAMEDLKSNDLFSVICSTFRFHIACMYPTNTNETLLEQWKYKFPHTLNIN